MASLSNPIRQRNRAAILSHRLGLTVLLTLLVLIGNAQTFPLQIQVSVMPPYSAYLQDYPGTGQQVRVFLINTSRQTYQVRLSGQLTGDNGIEIRTSPNYRPPRPLTVPPGQTLLSRSDLEGLFDLNQIEVIGIDKNLLARGFPLPDGTYQLCVRAYNETAANAAGVTFGQALSPEFPLGCSAPIVVRSVEPPILISPLCDAEVTATTPQAVVFTWTSPAGVSPAAVEYTLRVVELPQADVDPNVFIDAIALPRSGVEMRNLRTSTFLYGPTQPPLQLGKRYAWRVQAVDRSRRINFLNDGKSPVCVFTYGAGLPQLTKTPGLELVQTPLKIVPIPGLITGQDTPPAGATAVANKVTPAPSKVAKSGVICKSVEFPDEKNPQTGSLAGKTVKLGEFDLTIATDNAKGSTHTGEGRISWNGAPIKVKFTGLQINGENKVFDGEVVSDSKGPGIPNFSLGQLSNYASLPNNYFDQITTTLTESAKQAVAIPLPLKYEGKLGTVGINQMVFSPVGAKMDLVAGISLPEANLNLFLAAVDVCTSPTKKLPNKGTLYLIKDFPMPFPGGQKFIFKQSDPTSTKPDGTYAKIVNGDFDSVRVVADLNLGSTILKLDDGKGSVKAGDVVGTISASFVQWADWVGNVALPPFQLPGVTGVTFTGNDILYDHSDLANPDGFSVPAEYKGEKGLAFRGTYFKKVTVELPKSFKDSPRIGVSVNGGILDESGFTGLITSANKPLLDYTKGSLAGFGFGIDDVQWTIVQNSNRGGQITGKLQFPISTDAFSYSCNLSGGFDNILFVAAPKDGYEVPLFAATMDLNANTAINVTYKANQKIQVSMNLNGKVAINVKKFAGNSTTGKIIDGVIPKLCFQTFTITNTAGPNLTDLGGSGLYLNTGKWQLDSECAVTSPASVDKTPKSSSGPWSSDDDLFDSPAPPPNETKPSLSGFPLDFEKPTIVSRKDGKAGIRLGIGLHLGEAGDDKSFIQARGTVDILGTVTSANGRFKPAYYGIEPQNISIEGPIGPLTVKGGLDFINHDNTYGDGIKGNVDVTLPGFDVKLKMMMLFGNVNGFKYGFIDGSAQFGTGIPIVGPVVLTGLGGGMHYNMGMTVNGQDALASPGQVTKLAKATTDNKTALPPVDPATPGKTLSGAVFTPKKGGWGFTAKIYAGLADPHVFNASLAMTIDFTGGSLSSINMHGNANVISTSGDGDGSDGIAHAAMDITYAQSVLDASLTIDASYLDAVKVKIPFSMHVASKDDWCVKLGDPNGERINVTLLKLGSKSSMLYAYLAANGYFATGVGPSLGGLPPVPSDVSKYLTSSNDNTLPEAKAAYKARKMPNLAPIGIGYKLLMGGTIQGDLQLQVEPFRFKAGATIGFDAALMKGFTCGEGITPGGVSGWYGQGQAYAYLYGGIDLYVDTWFVEGSFNLMKLEAGAVFKAGLPNPAWADGKVKISGSILDGLLSVETTQNFAFGEKCTPVYKGDPLKDIEIISQILPADGETDVTTLPTMAVSFNMPMDKVFEVYISSDDIRYYKFIAGQPGVTVKPVKGSMISVTDLTPVKWSSDKRSYTVAVKSYQPSNATFQLSQMVTIKEMVGGQYGYPADPMNHQTGKKESRSQLKSSNFTLGKQPDEIPLETITDTWPINGQQYFLKGHLPTGTLVGNPLKGLECLKLEAGLQLMANFRGDDNSLIVVPISYDGENTLTFPIPAKLQNSRHYTLEIGKQAKSSGTNAGPLTSSKYVTLAQSPDIQLYRTTLNSSAVQAMAAVNESNQAKKIFAISFSTSKFSTFSEKLNALNLKATDYKFDQEIYLKPALDTYERFDRVDLFNTQIYPNFRASRLLNYETPVAGTPYANTPYEKEVRTMIYDKMKLLAEDGMGSYSIGGNSQGASADFKRSTLGEFATGGGDYGREQYTDPSTGESVSGEPHRVLFLSSSSMSYNPASSALSWRYVRDKLAYWDLVALSGIMKALTKLNYHDVLGGKQYSPSPDKGLSDQAYMTKYHHDPSAESCAIYQPTLTSTYTDQKGNQAYNTWPNPNYRMMEGVDYDGYGSIISSSPWMTLYIKDFTGPLYRKKQYWKFAEDNYYKIQGYTDNQGVDHDGGPERGKNSPFTVVFNYGKANAVKSVSKVFTIGSINDQPVYQIFMPVVFYPFDLN
jgi:hypothetical protein